MSVANTGFMLDRLGQDCSALQFLRELTQNSIEAILALPDPSGNIIWDVDWNYVDLENQYKLSLVDTGIGMTGPEMVEYINKLSSSGRTQAYDANYGVGAKIAAATRNHAGLIYLSWKDGHGAMVHLCRDQQSGTYGLKQFSTGSDSFDHWVPVTDDVKPDVIDGHGTKIVLMGNDEDSDTMVAPEGAGSPSRWVTYYLNTRYFRLPAGVTLRAREGWTNPRSNLDSNVLRTLTGQGSYLVRHSECSGTVSLSNAEAHWWILKNENALRENSGIYASNGHVAALYQDELYEMSTGRSGMARLQSFGIIFGYQQVVIYIEPRAVGDQILTSNTARTHLLINGIALPWVDWATEFRANMPDEIKELMEQVTAGTNVADHRQAIRERLRQIRDLFRLSRYRPASGGTHLIDPELVVVGPESTDTEPRRRRTRTGSGGGGGGQPGNLYALFVATDGTTPAIDVSGTAEPEVHWVTAAEGTRTPPDLEDRAARYLADQNKLLINGDFRVFTDFVSRWRGRYQEVPGAGEVVSETVREWFEQALVETVIGTLSLRGSREWSSEHIESSLSEEALTAAVMPRYHIEMAVRRALGARLGTLRERNG